MSYSPELVLNRTRDARLGAYLEGKGVRVSNPSAVSFPGNDKWKAFCLAKRLGLPVMETFRLFPENIGNPVKKPPFPLVLKSRSGHGGTEVFLIRNESELKERLDDPELAGRRWILQRLSDTPGKDVRVYIIGGKIAAAVLRTNKEDFRSNFSLGGQVKLYTLSEDEKRLVRRLTDVVNIDFCGIDFVFHEGRPVFNELEDMAGSRSLYALTDRDIAGEYVSYLL
ncbi:MAG: ATP-grasp domain-containing protein [Lachnospiraceae bacterium]|nr:ATP-grasp domain-containing protein [Lachnospiraceae bacterium]